MSDSEDDKKKPDLELFKPLDMKQLEQLEQLLNRDEIAWLQAQKDGSNFRELVKKYQDALPDDSTIFADMSTLGFFEQDIEIKDKYVLTLRTLTAAQYDEVERKVFKEGMPRRDYERASIRRQLAWGLQAINNNPPAGCPMSTRAPYFGLAPESMKLLADRVDSVDKFLSAMPEVFLNLMLLHRSAWDSAVINKVNGIKITDVLKN